MSDTAPNTDTATTEPQAVAPLPYKPEDIVRRAVARLLPCKLTDEEMLRIARTRVGDEATRDQLVADAKQDAEERKEQIKKYDEKILVQRRELHTGYQERTILTTQVFEPDGKGGGFIVMYRNDTNTPTGEKWPASPAELQRHLPDASGTGSILDQASKVQRSAQPETASAPTEGDVPEGLPDDDAGDEGGDVVDADESKSKRAKKGSK